MVRSIALAGYCLLFCAGTQNLQAQADSRIETAEAAVKGGLKDPGSAEFRNVAIKTNSMGETAVCGEFNARNSLGGYVGFQSFGVGGNETVTQGDSVAQDKLARMGCFGSDAELKVRHSDAQIELANKLHEQASFTCSVIWVMMDNRFRQQQDSDSAIDAAIVAITNRAKENKSEVSLEMLKAIRSQFEAQLLKIAIDKKTVDKIRKGDVTFKDMFTSSCSLQTDQILRVRAGLQ